MPGEASSEGCPGNMNKLTRACKGVAASAVPVPSDAGEVFKKFVKKSMKNYNFLNFQENFAIFSKKF